MGEYCWESIALLTL